LGAVPGLTTVRARYRRPRPADAFLAARALNLGVLLAADVTDPLTLMEAGPASFEESDLAGGGVGATSPPAAA